MCIIVFVYRDFKLIIKSDNGFNKQSVCELYIYVGITYRFSKIFTIEII